MSGNWKPSPDAVKREADEKDKSDCSLAVQCMELAVKHHAGNAVSNKTLTDTAEWIYRWMRSSEIPAQQWPDPQDWNNG